MKRGLTTVDGGALVVSSVVGAGIFTVPAYVTSIAGSPSLIIALWIVGGLMALAGALSYAELAARLPRGGGEYVYLREAFGPAAGFLSGWTSFVAGFSGAIAAAAVGFAHQLVQLAPSLGVIPGEGWAVGVIIAFTLVTGLGIRASRLATNGLAVMVVVGILVIIAGGIVGWKAPIASEAVAGTGVLSALVPIFFTYSGWNAAAYVTSEFHEPSRTVPRALIIGTLSVTLLYVALNTALLGSLSVLQLGGADAPVALAATRAFGRVGGSLVGVLVMAALASSVCALIITGSRIYRQMALDGALPPFFALGSGDGRVPVISAVTQSAWSCVLVLSGTFGQIVVYTGFSILLFSAAAVVALFVLRARRGPPATYRVPGYPFVPATFVLMAVVAAVASFRFAPGPSVAGIGLIAAGAVVFALGRRSWERSRYGRVKDARTFAAIS